MGWMGGCLMECLQWPLVDEEAPQVTMGEVLQYNHGLCSDVGREGGV